MMNKMVSTLMALGLMYFNLHGQTLTQHAFIETAGIVTDVEMGQENVVYFTELTLSNILLHSVDISDPQNPVILDTYSRTGFSADFEINGDIAYLMVADENPGGIQIVDISDPNTLQGSTFVPSGERGGSFFQNGFLYVTGGGVIAYAPSQNPDTLTLQWFFPTPAGNGSDDVIEIFADNDYVYFNAFQRGFFIVDKLNQQLVGALTGADLGFGLTVNGGYAYLTNSTEGLISVDITDPQQPVALDTLAGYDLGIGGGVFSAGNVLYFADAVNGLRVINIADPANLAEVSAFAPDSIGALRVTGRDSLLFLASGDINESSAVKNGLYIIKTDIPTAISENPVELPQQFTLHQNFPNPFNPSTTIDFDIEKSATIELKVYNLAGQLVRELVNRVLPAGRHSVTWDGRDQNGNLTGSGFYFYRLKSGQAFKTRRMLLLK